MTATFWTEQRIAELTDFVHAGLTFEQIGLRFGVTKNAAIGKAQRLGIEGPNSLGPINPILSVAERLDALNVFPAAGGCVFPIGNPGTDGFHFCAEQVAIPLAPYCAEHMLRCHQKGSATSGPANWIDEQRAAAKARFVARMKAKRAA